MRARVWRTALLAAAALLPAAAASALLCFVPIFTPVHLAEKATTILVVELGYLEDGKPVEILPVRAIKGKVPRESLSIDLAACTNEAHRKAARELLSAPDLEPGLLVNGHDVNDQEVWLLHISGKWLRLDRDAKTGKLGLDLFDSHLEATWAGDSEGLTRLTELIVKHPEISVPEAAGGAWREPVKAGRIAGKVREARAVDVAGRAELWLHLASEDGDQLLGLDPGTRKFRNLAPDLKLAARSRCSAWGDFTGDGRLDLASWDGERFTLWVRGADGTFAAAVVPGVPGRSCLGLEALDVGTRGRAGLLWSLAGAPVLFTVEPRPAGGFALAPRLLPTGAVPHGNLGAAGRCLVADFDGDGFADVLQPFALGSRLFRGKGNGEFARAAPASLALGKGCTGAFAGDWNADGLLDVVALPEGGPRLWQNAGGGAFEEKLRLSGEIAYISRPGAFAGQVCDFNRDGWQDVFLLYREDAPQLFFNRGFRSLSHAHSPADLAESQALPAACKGQQAGVVADFTGDGAGDMVLVLPDGEIWLRAAEVLDEGGALCARVRLAPGGPSAGPLVVQVRDEHRPLGAWLVAPGTAEACVGLTDPGELTVTWQLPGQRPSSRKLTVEDKPVRFEIPQDRP